MQNYKCQGVNKNGNNCGCKEYYNGRFINGLMCACGDNCWKHCPVCKYGGTNSCDNSDNLYEEDEFVVMDDNTWAKTEDYVETEGEEEEEDDEFCDELEDFEDDNEFAKNEIVWEKKDNRLVEKIDIFRVPLKCYKNDNLCKTNMKFVCASNKKSINKRSIESSSMKFSVKKSKKNPK